MRERLVNQRVAVAPMEPRAAVAWWDGDQRLHQYACTQGAHGTRNSLAKTYGLEHEQVHVIAPDVGGGFGGKSGDYPEETLLGWFARDLGRPVRWAETRTQNMLGMYHGRAQVHECELSGTATATARVPVAGARRLRCLSVRRRDAPVPHPADGRRRVHARSGRRRDRLGGHEHHTDRRVPARAVRRRRPRSNAWSTVSRRRSVSTRRRCAAATSSAGPRSRTRRARRPATTAVTTKARSTRCSRWPATTLSARSRAERAAGAPKLLGIGVSTTSRSPTATAPASSAPSR